MASTSQRADDDKYDKIKEILESIGCSSFINIFIENKIDTVAICRGLTDNELSRVGITTIGDRARFREEVNKEVSRPHNMEERISLFRPSRSRFSSASANTNKKSKRPRTWTCDIMCLADKDTKRTPTAEEKLVLKMAGLGIKKIQFCLDDTEEMFHKKLVGPDGFSKLNESGGFELLRCQSNCRALEPIVVTWTPESLRSVVGSQAKIYIRPIQRSLSLESIIPTAKTTQLMEKCFICKKELAITELRQHLKVCAPEGQTSGVHDPQDTSSDITSNTEDNVTVVEPVTVVESVTVVEESRSRINTELERRNTAPVHSESEDDLPELYSLRPISKVEIGHPLKKIIDACIDFCTENKVSDPVEILRILRGKIVYGRELDLVSESTTIEGETNFIVVNRQSLLPSAFEEINELSDLRFTLEVQFYGEAAVDLGGPRREFLSLAMREIKLMYFDPVKEWSKDYVVIGKIFALSTLQNGVLPRILTVELLEELFESENPRPFMMDLRKGIDSLGLFQLVRGLPSLVHLFTPRSTPPVITLKMMTNLLQPDFSPDGSNRKQRESRVYSKFIKYLRETASGRRGDVTLDKVLKFTTGVEEEPVLGFGMKPSLHFIVRDSYLPTGNTCINRLTLTVNDADKELPSDDYLFKLYDYGFSNAYFGLQ